MLKCQLADKEWAAKAIASWRFHFTQSVKAPCNHVWLFSCSDMGSHLTLKSHLNTSDLQILQWPFCTSLISICILGTGGLTLFFEDPASLNLDAAKNHVRTGCAPCIIKLCPGHPHCRACCESTQCSLRNFLWQTKTACSCFFQVKDRITTDTKSGIFWLIKVIWCVRWYMQLQHADHGWPVY